MGAGYHMPVSSTGDVGGGRILHALGKICVASSWHAENDTPPENWRAAILSELVRRAEDIDADAIVSLDYETREILSVKETGVRLKRFLATGIAVKLSCATEGK